MPRDGSNIYHRPPGTDGIPNYTIESAKYNANVADVEQDLNLPRPIVAGGTGANNALDARTNLQAEVAAQVVTNYDTQIWENGSFFSAAGATGAPNGHAFSGTAIVADPTIRDFVILEAHDIQDSATPGKIYRREKRTTWGSWTAASTVSDSLTLQGNPGLILQATIPPGTGTNDLASYVGPTIRWTIRMADGTEGGGNSGSNFSIYRFNDGGTLSGHPLLINRATGAITTEGTSFTVGNVTDATLNVSGGGGNSFIVQNHAGGGSANYIYGRVGGSNRWTMSLGDASGFENFSLTRHNDSGTATGIAITIARSDGTTQLEKLKVLPAGTTASVAQAAATAQIGFSGTGVAWRPLSDGIFPAAFQNAADTLVGYIQTSATTTSYATSSDARLKEDLKSFDAGHIVDDTNVYDFSWKSTGERSYGMIAQQANEVYPAAVSYMKDQDAWGIDYSKYVPVLLQELKALRARVRELEGRIDMKPQPA